MIEHIDNYVDYMRGYVDTGSMMSYGAADNEWDALGENADKVIYALAPCYR